MLSHQNSQLKMVMSELVKLLCLFNPVELHSDHFPAWLHWPRGIAKDPTVWLDGARPPPEYGGRVKQHRYSPLITVNFL